jgi:hypothetical protein
MNSTELVLATHTLQAFVTQAACARLGIFDARDWWEDT